MNNIKNMNSHVATTTDEQNNMTKRIEEQVSSTLLSVRKATELFESTKNEVKRCEPWSAKHGVSRPR
ncbi:hypothetical protein Psal006b_02719 [Piscirickettsia salmonis]|uniref:Sensory box protein n=2 Tax=Piscirickettsia salmonis TaxID=1238 RepID=A0AAC8VG92_PISSA|nr:hypothetical protein [Piscirickettsia salmonis]ALB21681.1 sensory box protein [Piscirickettsia salmonis]QGN99700.1 hypothetical protein Psal006b_02719 [Piscirickettsia salmonis]QGO03351.1 hypothetical protein Psal008_02751 [Piscirickettsia salmonis]QGO13982.1 hypothetical protein Psal010b_02713 [Piscirickettsia salmonis]QGO21078.1 hypothetical protein Psal013_02755 [Piscirickettsia salmonis]